MKPSWSLQDQESFGQLCHSEFVSYEIGTDILDPLCGCYLDGLSFKYKPSEVNSRGLFSSKHSTELDRWDQESGLMKAVEEYEPSGKAGLKITGHDFDSCAYTYDSMPVSLVGTINFGDLPGGYIDDDVKITVTATETTAQCTVTTELLSSLVFIKAKSLYDLPFGKDATCRVTVIIQRLDNNNFDSVKVSFKVKGLMTR